MEKLRTTLLALLLIIVPTTAAWGSSSDEWTIDNLPMVHLQDASRYLVNPDGLVSKAIQDSCDIYLRALEKEKGIQTVFVVVRHMKGSDDLANVSSRLGDKYGVGDKKTSRGLVIIIATEDRRWFIAPGSGLQGDYPDISVKNIGEACIVPNMRQGNIDMAALATCKAFYSGRLENNYEEDDDDMSLSDAIAIMLIIGFFVYLLFKHGGRGGGGFFFFGGPPFFGGGFGGGSHGSSGYSGGSFGGGSFNGGGSGGSW